MKVYKNKQYLVFCLDDNSIVKYDFATKTCIGKKGNPVKNLCSQLSGVTMSDIISSCEDPQYAKFLQFVQERYSWKNRNINNIGTILSHVPDYAKFEQIFSAGFEDICDGNFSLSINEIPKGLIKLCKTRHIKLSNDLVNFYRKNPNAYNYPWEMEHMSLTDYDILDVLKYKKQEKVYYGTGTWQYDWKNFAVYNRLIDEYGYTAKALFNYLDYCKTFEAIDNMPKLLGELYDYANMMKQISGKFDKYPRHFLTTHKIACRNYERLKKEFDEQKFISRIDKSMEKTFGDYSFIYPESTQDIKDEAANQSNCVASYIDKVLNGECHILFLRHKDRKDQSLVTIEVRDNKIVQARQRFNDPCTLEQNEVIEKWNQWRKRYVEKLINNTQKENNNESEELKHAC